MPIIPGSENNIENLNEAKKVSEKIGYPIIIKSTNGGGGRGIKIVKNENELKKNLELAKKRLNKVLETMRFILKNIFKTQDI